jgi:hypothetical protein
MVFFTLVLFRQIGCQTTDDPGGCQDYSFNPTKAGVEILEEHPVSGTMDVENSSFGKDENYFYLLNNFILQKYSAVDYSLISETNLEQDLISLGQSQDLLSPKIDHKKFAVFQEILIFMVVFNSTTNKMIEVNTSVNIARFIDNLPVAETMGIGYNPDESYIWINNIYQTIFYKYTYDPITNNYYMINFESGGSAGIIFVNNDGIWNRYTDPGVENNILVKYSLDSIQEYSIFCTYLEPVSYHIVPDGTYLWAIVRNNITKMEPLSSSAASCSDQAQAFSLPSYFQNFGLLAVALGYFGFRRKKKRL